MHIYKKDEKRVNKDILLFLVNKVLDKEKTNTVFDNFII